MRYARTLFAFFSTPWALDVEKYNLVRSILLERAAGVDASLEQMIAAAEARRTQAGYTQVGKVAIIPIMGVISQRPSVFSSGGTSTEAVGRQLDAAVSDKTVSKIVLQIDSPGGSVAGVTELAAKIRAAGEAKKVIAHADATAASAAYWLGSQAAEFYSTPSGRVGSIGVISEYVDTSKADEAAGVKTTLVTAGKFKGENRGEPLTEGGLAKLQADVNAYYDMFVGDVAKGRGVTEATVRNGFGEGRAMIASEAKKEGMIDGVVSFEKLLARLNVSITPAGAAARARAVEISD